MTDSVKIRAREVEGVIRLKCIIKHPMESGLRKIKKTGKKIPAHYIREVFVRRNGKLMMEAFWGKSMARNPFLSLELPGRKGDLVEVSWVDNRGNADKAEAKTR